MPDTSTTRNTTLARTTKPANPTAMATNRAERRAASAMGAKTKPIRTWMPEGSVDAWGGWWLVAVIAGGTALATFGAARSTLIGDYERSLEYNIRIVATNVATCVKSGRTLDTRPPAPLCLDPKTGAMVSTDLESGFPTEGPTTRHDAPAATGGGDAAKQAARTAPKPRPAILATYGRHAKALLPYAVVAGKGDIGPFVPATPGPRSVAANR